MRHRILSAFILSLAVLLPAAGPGWGQSTDAQSNGFANPRRFAYEDGGDLYRAICQGCHMPDGKGAIGAGAYPALAGNANLEAAGYPVHMIVNGQKAMPSFHYLSDAQVASVVNYIRSHFGNQFKDAIGPTEVKEMRPAP